MLVAIIGGVIAGLIVWWLTNFAVRRVRRWVRPAE
jgi:fructose-specific phosphotransferase system IIC component